MLFLRKCDGMIKNTIKRGFLILLSMLFSIVYAQEKPKPEDTELWYPVPNKISFFSPEEVPSDAVILFDGSGLSQWEATSNDELPQWTVNAGVLTVKPKSGDIQTKQHFKDFQLHIEWRSPEKIVGAGQGRGNSGVFMQGLYEIQILDSYQNETYSNGQAASVYKQNAPLVNATKRPGEWQTYNIIWTAPLFDEAGELKEKARVTVIHNGVVVQNNTEVQGTTEYIGLPKKNAHGAGPIILQDHGDLVSFRNIWIREL